MTQIDSGTFGVWIPSSDVLFAMRRVPVGRTDQVIQQILFGFEMPTNEDLTVYDFDLILTYWPTESLYRPGFLSSFWEAPLVPIVP